MSALCRQFARLGALRGLQVSTLTARRGYVSQKDMLPDPLELATGLEKRELLALQAGNDDPFYIKPVKKGAGTKDAPTLIPSCFDSRIVGCICDEHSSHVNWMWLHKNQARRCECGHWYKLQEKTPL